MKEVHQDMAKYMKETKEREPWRGHMRVETIREREEARYTQAQLTPKLSQGAEGESENS